MGQRGPSKKPTAIKKLLGNPGKHKLPENEMTVDPILPDCPEHLDEEAQAEWKRITAVLAPIGLLTLLDRAVLSMYCSSWSDWVKYSKKVQETAPVIKSPSGYAMMNPYVSLADRALEKMQRTFRGLGLSPGDRASINMPSATTQPETDLDRFIRSKPTRW